MRDLLDIGQMAFDCAACAAPPADDGRRGDTHDGPQDGAAGSDAEAVLPPLSWAMIDRQLRDLAMRPELRQIVTPMLRSLHARAPGMSPDAVLREILCLAWVVMEEPPPRAASGSR